MGMAAILVMWPAPFNKFLLPHPKAAALWNLASIGPVVSEEKMFENVDIHTYIHTHTHIHTHIHTYIHTYTHIHVYTYIHEAFLYYQLTYEPKGLGQLKRSFFQRKEFIFNEGISQWWTPLSSMPMIPIYGKNLKKSFSPEPHGRWPGNLVCSIGCSSTTMFVQIITIGWPWHILWQGQIWSLMLLYGKKVKQWIFQKLLSYMIWN